MRYDWSPLDKDDKHIAEKEYKQTDTYKREQKKLYSGPQVDYPGRMSYAEPDVDYP